MDPITLANALGFLILTGYAALKARGAEKYAKPTGNGFADHVKASLARIEHRIDRVEDKLDRKVDKS